MNTIIRNDKGEITHVHYYGRYYLKNADHLLVRDTTVTKEMIQNAIKDPLYVFKRLINDEGDTPETMKLYIMIKNDYPIIIYDNKGDEINVKLVDF